MGIRLSSGMVYGSVVIDFVCLLRDCFSYLSRNLTWWVRWDPGRVVYKFGSLCETEVASVGGRAYVSLDRFYLWVVNSDKDGAWV